MRFTPFALSLLAVAVCLQAQAETVSKADTAKPAAIELDANIVTASRTRSSIADIAGELGFAESSAFHRAFKKWTGIRPGEYRYSVER